MLSRALEPGRQRAWAMNLSLAEVADWLKTTVPGIIVLGAVGSIVAAGVLWVAHRLLYPYLVKFSVRILVRIVTHFVGPAVAQIARFVIKNGDERLPLFYTLQVMKLLLALFLSACSFVLFALALGQPADTLARAAVLMPLVFSFLGLWYGLRCVAIVALPLYVDIYKQIEEAKARVMKEMAAEKNAR